MRHGPRCKKTRTGRESLKVEMPPNVASLVSIFEGGGVARETMRSVDWAKTPVGAPETWPPSLRTTLGIILNSRHPMFLWWGPDLIQFYNDAYVPSFGQGKHPAAMGQRGADCWQEIWPIIYPQIDDVMARGKASWNESQLVPIFRNGRLEDVYWTYGYSPVLDDAGGIGGVLVVCTETTAGVLAVQTLERTNEERARLLVAAQAASRAKDEFLAMLGHELRNPLTPILTAIELMKGKSGTIAQREREIIERQTRHLVHLVDDLLDVARVAEGKIELRKRRVSLAHVVALAIETVTPLFENKGHELRIDVPAEGLELDVDPVRLAQVVSNVLTNAARYTNAGGTVTITAQQLQGHAVLRIQDTGIGIAPEQIPFLFERFFQGAARGLDRTGGGLGLGLALVKSLVELHGGSVKVESAGLGKGATFELRVPLATGDAPRDTPVTEAQRITPDMTLERVLLVDDNEDITELYSDYLQLEGFEVRTAHDGPNALRIAADFKPTVAVVDLGLPVMDGYELAAQLRQRDPSTPRLIAMSGYGQRDDIARTQRAGFEAHLVKPVDIEAVLAAIANKASAVR